MIRIFKTRNFVKWAKKEKVNDSTLKTAVTEMERGLFDGNLGNGLYKKRMARLGEGKRSGYRSLVVFRKSNRAFFVFGFAKNDRENIDSDELLIYRQLAQQFLSLSDDMINKMIQEKTLFEVSDE